LRRTIDAAAIAICAAGALALVLAFTVIGKQGPSAHPRLSSATPTPASTHGTSLAAPAMAMNALVVSLKKAPSSAPTGVRRGPKRASTPAAPTPLRLAAAMRVARSEAAAGRRIGFAVVSSDGRMLAQLHSSVQTYSASITKAMLLIAYLRQHADALSQAARAELTDMIEISDNGAADWVYDHLVSPHTALTALARDAGMSGLQVDTSDPVYVLGQSLITAGDFAHLFARIDQLLPGSQRAFGLHLLARVEQRVGLLDAGLPDVVYSKEGWKPEPAGLLGSPYIVNQAAQFTYHGTTYGVAVTVGAVSDQPEGEAVVRRIVSALL
jgi:hypothetical protein